MAPPISSESSLFSRALRIVTLEPAIFLITLAFGIQGVILQNLLIDRSCLVTLGQNWTVCSQLEQHPLLQSQVEKLVSTLRMEADVLTSVPGVFYVLFLGPYSDKHGRKPLLILPALGSCLGSLVLLILTLCPKASANWYLLVAISGIVGGGFAPFLAGIFLYISDVTDQASRTSRIGILDFTIFLGFPLGTFASAPLFARTGFLGVFTTSLLLNVLALLYFCFVVKESRGPHACHPGVVANVDNEEDVRLVDLDHVWNVMYTCFRWRPQKRRRIILLLMMAILVVLISFATSGLTYLYTRLVFSWTEQQFVVWSSLSALSNFLGSVLLLPLMSFVLGMHDMLIGLVAAISGCGAALVYAFVDEPWMFYLGSLVGLLASSSGIVVRSSLSKLVSPSELGALFSLLSCFEAITPILAVPLLTMIYNDTLDSSPGTVFLLQAAAFALAFCSFAHVLFLMRTQEGFQYGEITQNDEENDNNEHEDNDMDSNSREPLA